MLRVGKILRLQTGLVALRADRRRLGRTQRFETNDLGDIAAPVNVGLCRTVTSLASMLIALEQRGVRRTREVLVPHFLVTCLTNLGIGVLAAGRPRQRGGCLRSWVSWVLLRSQQDRQAESRQGCQDERQEFSAFAVSHPRPQPHFTDPRGAENEFQFVRSGQQQMMQHSQHRISRTCTANVCLSKIEQFLNIHQRVKAMLVETPKCRESAPLPFIPKNNFRTLSRLPTGRKSVYFFL